MAQIAHPNLRGRPCDETGVTKWKRRAMSLLAVLLAPLQAGDGHETQLEIRGSVIYMAGAGIWRLEESVDGGPWKPIDVAVLKPGQYWTTYIPPKAGDIRLFRAVLEAD